MVNFGQRCLKDFVASTIYVAIEGIAFALNPRGILLILGSELAVSTVQQPQRVARILSRGAACVVVGRMCVSIFTLCRCRGRRKGLMVEPADGKGSDAVTDSIWDWQPPENDIMASSAWLIMKELVMTMRKLKEEYPEIDEYLNKPECSPVELAARLFYFYRTCCTKANDDGKMGSDGDTNTVRESNRQLSADEGEGLSKLKEYRDFCMFAYNQTNDESLSQALKERGFLLLGAQYKPDLIGSCSPAFYLAASDEGSGRREIMLVIRGTYSEEDVFMDLFANGTTFGEHGTAHMGMSKAAVYLDERFGGFFANFVSAGRDCMVTLTGHSLGAGVSSLLALKLLERGIPTERMQCLLYEPPACMSKHLAATSLKMTWSLVNNDDIVPRLAFTPFLNFLHDLCEFDWKSEQEKDQDMPLLARKLASLLLASGQGKDSGDMPSKAIVKTRPKISTNYDPVVPGRIIFISPGQEPVCIRSDDCLLRNLRVSSTMITDHFIDTAQFEEALSLKTNNMSNQFESSQM
jgi:hypothetical protein